MATTSSPGGPPAAAMDIPALVALFSRRAQLAQAVDLARAGHLAAAENLLGALPSEEPASPLVLDLRARIRAQQGRLAEAAELWNQALRLAPANEGIRAALHRIGRLQRRPVWLGVVWPVVVGAMVVLAVALLATRGIKELEAWRGMAPERPAASPLGAPAPRRSATALLTRLQVSGVTLRLDGDTVAAVFDAGLFARGATLNPSGAALLTEFGRKLESQSGLAFVDVVGCTDDVPMPAPGRYEDNYALGLDRAVAAVEHLRTTTRVPVHFFRVRSSGGIESPFPNDTPANRARNRTVTLRIATVD